MKRSASLLSIVLASHAIAHEPEAERPFERIHTHERLAVHLHSGWESAYSSEGRDNLDGRSLWATSIELGSKHLSGGIWYGLSPDTHYDEVQITLALSESIGEFEVHAGFTHLRFPSADACDNEFSIGAGWAGLPFGLQVTTDAYYSVDAEGAFWEVGLNREIEISKALALTAAATFGVNQGYVRDGHDGANHVSVRLGAEYAITKSIAFTAHVACSWAVDRDPAVPGDALLTDFFHGGVGIQWEF